MKSRKIKNIEKYIFSKEIEHTLNKDPISKEDMKVYNRYRLGYIDKENYNNVLNVNKIGTHILLISFLSILVPSFLLVGMSGISFLMPSIFNENLIMLLFTIILPSLSICLMSTSLGDLLD